MMMARGRKEAKTQRKRTKRKRSKMKPLTTARMTTDKIERLIYRVFFFTGPPPKSSKCQPVSNYFQKKIKYQDWPPLKVPSVSW